MTTSQLTYSNEISLKQIQQLMEILIIMNELYSEIQKLSTIDTNINLNLHNEITSQLRSAIKKSYKNECREVIRILKGLNSSFDDHLHSITNLSGTPGYNLYHILRNQKQIIYSTLLTISSPIITTIE